MRFHALDQSPQACARVSGLLYLAIIACGIFAEFHVRGGLIVPGDAAATAGNIAGARTLFGLGLAADLVMLVCDVALALFLYVLLRPAGQALALLAAFFRLVQASTLSLNLLHQFAAGLVIGGNYAPGLDASQSQALMLLLLDIHKFGYYVGLVFFAFNCFIVGVLILRAGYLPRILGVLMGIAAIAYLSGSLGALLFPAHEPLIANSPFYLVPVILAEFSFCLWLLIRGVDLPRWRAWQAA